MYNNRMKTIKYIELTAVSNKETMYNNRMKTIKYIEFTAVSNIE